MYLLSNEKWQTDWNCLALRELDQPCLKNSGYTDSKSLCFKYDLKWPSSDPLFVFFASSQDSRHSQISFSALMSGFADTCSRCLTGAQRLARSSSLQALTL